MTKAKVREFILQKFPLAKSKGVDDSTALLEEGVLDSLGILELVDFLQNELGVVVDDDDLVPENFQSIGAIAGYVDAKGQAEPAT